MNSYIPLLTLAIFAPTVVSGWWLGARVRNSALRVAIALVLLIGGTFSADYFVEAYPAIYTSIALAFAGLGIGMLYSN